MPSTSGCFAILCDSHHGLNHDVRIDSAFRQPQLPTAELLKRFYPKVPVKAKLAEFETLLSNKKAREKLGFEQKHFWRTYVKA